MVPGAQAMPSFRNQETGVWAMKGKAAMVPSPWNRKVGLGYFCQKDFGQGGVQVLGEQVLVFH